MGGHRQDRDREASRFAKAQGLDLSCPRPHTRSHLTGSSGSCRLRRMQLTAVRTLAESSYGTDANVLSTCAA